MSEEAIARPRSACHLTFGRKNSTTREGRPWTYDQHGFIHRQGVVWVGQSVLILPRGDAYELRGHLERMGVLVGLARLTIDESNLAVFRRHSRARKSRAPS